MKWSIAAVLLAAGAYLFATSQGILVRNHAIFVNSDRVVTDAACTYSSGLRTETVLITGDPGGAACPPLYKFDSIATCRGFGVPGTCQQRRGARDRG